MPALAAEPEVGVMTLSRRTPSGSDWLLALRISLSDRLQPNGHSATAGALAVMLPALRMRVSWSPGTSSKLSERDPEKFRIQ